MNELTFAERCEIRDCTEDDYKNALEGCAVPLPLGHPILRLCIIRGIRYHAGFEEELRDVLPDFTRALNARLIMSNTIPSMTESRDFPHCIWYPDLASEDSYREVARRYPQLRYHVGRACAVAGYTTFYHELALLPDASIAEEPRDAGEKSVDIFRTIMAQPVRYSIMDDYSLSTQLDNPQECFGLNDDAAVRSVLNIRCKYRLPTSSFIIKEVANGIEMDRKEMLARRRPYWDITEDCGIDHAASELPKDESDMMTCLL